MTPFRGLAVNVNELSLFTTTRKSEGKPRFPWVTLAVSPFPPVLSFLAGDWMIGWRMAICSPSGGLSCLKKIIDKKTTPRFYVNCAQSQYRYTGAIQSGPFTRKPRRNELFLHFRKRHCKSRDSSLPSTRLKPPLGSAFTSHIADGAEPWCGSRACSKTRQPVRRPDLRCALLRPVSQFGSRAGICHPIFGKCALAPAKGANS